MSTILVINPAAHTIVVQDLEHRNDDGLSHMREILGYPYIESAPGLPTGDLLIVADISHEPDPPTHGFTMPEHVYGVIRGKCIVTRAGNLGQCVDVVSTPGYVWGLIGAMGLHPSLCA